MASRARVPGGGDFFAPLVSPSSAARHRRGFRGGWPSRSARWSTGRCRIAGRRHGGGGGSRRSCQAPTPVPARAGLPQAPHGPLDHRRAADRAEVRDGAIAASWGERRLEAVERLLRRSRVLPVDDHTTWAWPRLRHECRPRGHPLHQKQHPGDLWIAATAIPWQLPLVAHDPVFLDCPTYSRSPNCHELDPPTSFRRDPQTAPASRATEIRDAVPGLNEFEHLPGMSVLGMPCGSGLTLDVACPSPEVSLAAP